MRRYYSHRLPQITVTVSLILVLAASLIAASAEPVSAASKLKVTPKSKVINTGDTIKLKSNSKVKWSVSKGKGVIRLSSKKRKSVKIKGLKKGSAIVKAKRGKSVKKIKITVRGIAPASITLKVNRNVIAARESCIASISSVVPSNASKEVSWSSSDKTVATVSSTGLITGVKAGKATIYATSKLNSKVRGSVIIDVADKKSGTITATVSLSAPETFPSGKSARVWIPIPSDITEHGVPIQRISRISYKTPTMKSFATVSDADIQTDSEGNRSFYMEWGEDASPEDREVALSFHVKRRETFYPDDLASFRSEPADEEEYAQYLKETSLSGSFEDGQIVKETADRIVSEAGAFTAYEKAYAIYDWILENLSRDTHTPGLGKGDVEYILKHPDEPVGKCTDVNSVFDALCRAEGIPARGIFGMKFDNCGQKCKPQFLIPGYGWVDADPSEVLKQIVGKEDLYRGEGAPLSAEWKKLKAKYWAHADAGWFMLSEGRDIELSPRQSAAEADEQKLLVDGGALNYFVFPYAEYDGQALKCWGGQKEFSYTYSFEEDEDCGC